MLLNPMLQRRFTFDYYRQACAKRSHAGTVFTQWFKNEFFTPRGRHVALINVKFGTGERAKFYVYRVRSVGTQSPKLSKYRIFAINLSLMGDLFALFLRNSQHLCSSIGSF